MNSTLMRNRPFMLVWLAGMLVMLGFSMFFLSVSWLTIDVLEEPAALGIILIGASLPRVVMMIYGGVLADKMQKSKIMFVTNLLQALIMVAMVILFLNDAFTVTTLVIISAVFGFLDAFFFPAVSSMIPTIVRDQDLQRANSLFQGSTEMMFILGPLIAGILLTVGDFTLTFSVSGILIFLSAVLVFPPFIRDPLPVKREVATSALTDLKEGVAYVWKSPVHRSGTLAIVVINLFIMGPMIMSFPILVGAFGGSPFELSLLEGGLAVGTFLASVLVVLANWKKGRGRRVFYSLLGSLTLFFLFSQMTDLPLLVLLAALTGFVMMLVYLPTVTMVQEVTDKDKLGRVMSIISLAASGFEPIAFALLSLFVAMMIPIQTILAATAIIGILCGIALFATSRVFRNID